MINIKIKLYKLHYPETSVCGYVAPIKHQNWTALQICTWEQNTKHVSDIKVA